MIKQKIIQFVEFLHFRIFGHEMSLEMRKFLGNLSWSFISGILVLPIVLVVTTLAGRYLGPAEYGKYSLLLVVNQLIVIFVFFGLDTTSVKYIAKAGSLEERKKIIASTFNYILLALSILTLLTFISYPILHKFFPSYALFALLVTYYTVIISVKIILDLIIRGVEDFRRQAFGKIIEGAVIVVLFIIVFFVLKKNSFVSFLMVINGGAVMISLYYLFHLRKYFGPTDKKSLFLQFSESKYFFLSALLGTVYLSADRLVVARYLGISALGIYSAYYLASFGVVSQVTQLFTNVFFPVTSRLEDKSFAKKIDRLFWIGLLPISAMVFLIMLLMLFIFGKEYPMNFAYMSGFSIYSGSYFFQALYNTVIVDVPKNEYRKYIIERNMVNFATILVYLFAAPFHIVTVPFILVVLLANSFISIIIERLFIKEMQRIGLP